MKIKQDKTYKIVNQIASFLILFLGILFAFSNTTNAQPTLQCPISGWAWTGYTNPQWGYIPNSSGGARVNSGRLEGVGWVSFAGTVVNGTYGVQLDQNGWLTGYAWTPNIGWIRFGGVANSTNEDARIINNQVVGWARACAVFLSGCSGAVAPGYYTGGWDGWIALSTPGTHSGSYGVTYDPVTSHLSGWAWGGDIVGWLSFRDAGYGVVLSNDNECILTNAGLFNYNVQINPATVQLPSGGSGTQTVSSDVGISRASGTPPEDVSIVSISVVSTPNGVTVPIGNIQGAGLVCPNASCTLSISAIVNFGNSYAYSPSNNSITLRVRTDNHPSTGRPPVEKDTDFFITINPSGGSGNSNACTVDRSTALVNQAVRWTAPSNNLDLTPPLTYSWYHPNSVIPFGTGSSAEESYPTPGRVDSNVKICEDSSGSCRTSDICSSQIILNLEIEQF